MLSRRNFIGILSLFLATSALTGCNNNGAKLVEVSGTLTRNGVPVPYLTVHFVPPEGKASWGVSDESGRFTLKQNNKTPGVSLGTHHVWVDWRPFSPTEENDPKTFKKPPDLQFFRQKYGETKSHLQMTITKATDYLEVRLD